MSRRWVTTACTVGALTGFAANSLLTRAAVGSGVIDAVAFTTVRLLTGALALSALVWVSSSSAPERTAPPHRGVLADAAALCGYACAFAFAYSRIEAGIGALVLFTSVQLTMTGWGLLRGDRPRALEWLGLLAALAGLVVLTRPGQTAPDAGGAALMAAAGACWGVYSLRGRTASAPLRDGAKLHRGSAVRCRHRRGHAAAPRRPTRRLAGVISGAVASGVGYALWYRALPALSPFGRRWCSWPCPWQRPAPHGCCSASRSPGGWPPRPGSSWAASCWRAQHGARRPSVHIPVL